MNYRQLLDGLRAEPFYIGQILRVREFPAEPAETCPLATLLERVARLGSGSIEQILSVLGFEDVYTSHLGGLHRAFPEDANDVEDAVLVAPFSHVRETFWHLVCVMEALDEGRACLVLCRGEKQAAAAAAGLQDTICRADMEYALEAVAVSERSDFSAFSQSTPLILVLTPEMLSLLLTDSHLSREREALLSSLGRVVIPKLDSWQPALASNSAYLLRALHLECALRGVYPALAGTTSPALQLEEFVAALWGKPIDGRALVRTDSIESTSMCVVNYGGGLVRDPSDPRKWVRQVPGDVASKLIGWLVGKHVREGSDELHYVLDISGSMGGCLPEVRNAVVDDLAHKLQSGALGEGARVKLTVFDHEAQEVFSEERFDGLLDSFKQAIEQQAARGGTDIPNALGTSLGSVLSGGAARVDLVLFSDGGSDVSKQQQREIQALVRQARVEGRALRILYVVLDMDPPAKVKNLILGIGGKVVRKSVDELGGGFDDEQLGEGYIVVLSGEGGLPESIIQPFQAGRRPITFVREMSELEIGAQEVAAVVVSGRFPSLAAIKHEVRHLGREGLPVFILTEAEAWSQMLIEDHPEAGQLQIMPLVCPENDSVSRMRLRELVGDGEVERPHFRYLQEGAASYDQLLESLRVHESSSRRPANPDPAPELPEGFEELDRGWSRFVRWSGPGDPPDAVLDTWTTERVRLEGRGILENRDRATLSLVFHRGAVVDSEGRSALVESEADGRVKLGERRSDRLVPILSAPAISVLDPDEWSASAKTVDRLGEIVCGAVQLSTRVEGVRRFERANLEGRSRDERFAEADDVMLETSGALWKPLDAAPEQLNGLANILRLTLGSVFRWADQTVMVVPDATTGIWILDLAVGGNGAAKSFARDTSTLLHLLALGGRLALECPCEGGFAGASDAPLGKIDDTGCPRCTRAIGTVILDGASERFAPVSKKQTLEWLLANQHLVSSAETHLEEKYDGIKDHLRISGEDHGSRRGCIKLVRRIMRDRLGLDLEDSNIARFEWLAPKGNVLGLYDGGGNVLSILRNLREWLALDVTAHEFFHNIQFRADGVFSPSLGANAQPLPPMGGKLFVEGSAMWAESHVVDALAIRSSLEMANLRQGDEYGEGFQLMKYIEEHCGGVPAVLQFLATGGIDVVTGGKIRDLEHLYSLAGIAHAV